MRLLPFVLLLAACDTGFGAVQPEQSARKFMADLGLASAVQGVSCAGTDSDNDGYVTCTVALRQNDGPVTLESLQCADFGRCGSISTPPCTEGCKGTIAKAVPPSTVNR